MEDLIPSNLHSNSEGSYPDQRRRKPLIIVNQLDGHCDRCSVARARYRIEIGGLDLLLCAHHYNMHAADMLVKGYNVVDLDTESALV